MISTATNIGIDEDVRDGTCGEINMCDLLS